MALTKCPEYSKDVSCQAVACSQCGFPLANASKESAQVEQPEVEAVPKSTAASPPKKPTPGGGAVEMFNRFVAQDASPPKEPTPGCGCGGCLSAILLILWFGSIIMVEVALKLLRFLGLRLLRFLGR